MQNDIELQIAGSAPGFTVLFSDGWTGADLPHSSVRKESLQPVYYEASFEREYWTYVLVLCNFLSNVNREESFKIGIRFPARHCIVNSDGFEISPAVVLNRILDSLKATALIRRGTDTYRLRPDALFPAAEYESVFADYSLREIWGPVTESDDNGPDKFLELRGFNPEQPLMHLPYMASASGAARLYLGTFSDNVDIQLFSPVDMAAAPLVKVKIDGKDSFYDYCILPGRTAVLSSANYGYSGEAYENVDVALSYDDIIRTVGKCLDDMSGDGFKVFYNAADGIVKVIFNPSPRTVSYPIRIEGDCNDVPAVSAALSFSEGTIDDSHLTLVGREITDFMQGIKADPEYLLKNIRLGSHVPYTIKSARFDGSAVVLALVGSEPAAIDSGTVLLVRLSRPVPASEMVEVRIFPDSATSAPIRSYLFPAVGFEESDGARFARLRIGRVAPGEHAVVYIDNPASAECMAFPDDKGVYLADFGSSGRTRGFLERLSDVCGLSDVRKFPDSWKAVRWLLVAAVALLLLLAGIALGFFASSALGGDLPFFQKMK